MTYCKSITSEILPIASALALVIDTKVAKTATSFLVLGALGTCMYKGPSYHTFNKRSD